MQPKRKSLRPANDMRPPAARVAYVTLPQPYWTLHRVAVAGVLAGFGFLLLTAVAMLVPRPAPSVAALTDVAPTVAAAPVLSTPPVSVQAAPVKPGSATPPAPYDIVLDASQLDRMPEDQVNRLAADLPATVIESHAIHPVPKDGGGFFIEMVDAPRHPQARPIEVSRDEAAFQAQVAATLAQQGDLDQALRMQHRAAELAPQNMVLRLQLAILYDRAGDQRGAAMLYRQVLEASDRHVAALPPGTDLAGVRSRMSYLSAAR